MALLHGRASEAITLLQEMVDKTTIKPNSVTFIGLLTVCVHIGKVELCKCYFSLKRDEYGITPSTDHYTCMVDLLGQAGLVEEALEFVQSMPIEPYRGVWGGIAWCLPDTWKA